jgi:hypothetical protein
MTKNQTGLISFSAFGIEFVVLLLLTLAAGLAISNYFLALRENVRRSNLRSQRHPGGGRLAA